MKGLTFLGVILVGICVLGSHADAAEQSWEEFIKLKQQAETPKLIPKGGAKPRLLKKDLVIEEIRRTGQLNTGPSGGPGRPDITSEALLFEYGLPQLRDIPENQQNLKTIARALLELGKEYPHYFVDGHTCDIGSDENNCRLSWARARTVYDRLVAEGVDPQALTMRGFGENPNTTAVQNTSEENRKLNRRVVLIAYGSGAGSEWSGKSSKQSKAGQINQPKGGARRSGKDVDVVEAPVRGVEKGKFMCRADSYGIGNQTFSGSGTTGWTEVQEERIPDSEQPGFGDETEALEEKGRGTGVKKKTGGGVRDPRIPEGFKPMQQVAPKSTQGYQGQGGVPREGIPKGFKAE